MISEDPRSVGLLGKLCVPSKATSCHGSLEFDSNCSWFFIPVRCEVVDIAADDEFPTVLAT